jgi:hypothetical protein
LFMLCGRSIQSSAQQRHSVSDQQKHHDAIVN